MLGGRQGGYSLPRANSCQIVILEPIYSYPSKEIDYQRGLEQRFGGYVTPDPMIDEHMIGGATSALATYSGTVI